MHKHVSNSHTLTYSTGLITIPWTTWFSLINSFVTFKVLKLNLTFKVTNYHIVSVYGRGRVARNE